MKSLNIKYKLLIAVLVVAAIVLAVILGKTMIYEPVTNDATEKLMTDIATQYMTGEEAVRANQAISKMTDADKDRIKQIIDSRIESKDILSLVQAVEKGDEQTLRNYIHSRLTEKDKDEILDIYRKYD